MYKLTNDLQTEETYEECVNLYPWEDGIERLAQLNAKPYYVKFMERLKKVA